jgi:hypothetical protein
VTGPPGLQGPIGEPLGARKANAAWNKLVRVLGTDVPLQLHRAQRATKAIPRKRR